MELEMTTDHQEQMVSFSNKDATHIAKGKRTKRLRLLSLSSSSPCGAGAAGMSSSCSSAYSAGGDYYKYSSEEEEEEDMANCLILLAQGGGGGGESSKFLHDGKKMEKGNGTVSVSNRKLFSEITTATNKAGSTGLYIYECKTCNRTFSSFQALGGHRASHKKPKLVSEEKKPSPSPSPSPPPPPPSPPPKPVTKKEEHEGAGESQSRVNTISVRGGLNGNNNINKVAKIHECSICGSEFSSGQALGGHMRRHRATANIATAVKGVPQRNILELDLNLPAPEDDIRESMFHQFPVTTQKSMVLSVAPALVDCHY